MTLARVTTWADGNTLTAAALNGEFDNIINNPTALFSVVTDRLLGRDTAGTGNVEQLSVTNGLAFTGGPAIGIANDGVTYARMQNVSAASRLLGRGSAGGSGDVEEITLGYGLSFDTGTGLVNTGRVVMQFHSGSVGVAVAQTVYLGSFDSTFERVLFRIPFAGTVVAMYSAGPDAVAGVAQTWTYTLRVNGADTALTHVVTGAATTGNSAGTIVVAAGDGIQVKLVTSAGAGVSCHQVTLSIIPA